MPTPNMMPKTSRTAMPQHQLLSAINAVNGRRIHWCCCSPQDTSEGVLVIERHIQSRMAKVRRPEVGRLHH